MPQWDYRCTCGQRDTLEFRNADERDRVEMSEEGIPCIRCGDQMLRKPCAGSFVLKGAGFHANDYGKSR